MNIDEFRWPKVQRESLNNVMLPNPVATVNGYMSQMLLKLFKKSCIKKQTNTSHTEITLSFAWMDDPPQLEERGIWTKAAHLTHLGNPPCKSTLLREKKVKKIKNLRFWSIIANLPYPSHLGLGVPKRKCIHRFLILKIENIQRKLEQFDISRIGLEILQFPHNRLISLCSKNLSKKQKDHSWQLKRCRWVTSSNYRGMSRSPRNVLISLFFRQNSNLCFMVLLLFFGWIISHFFPGNRESVKLWCASFQ